jgi:hypothetical protein
MAVSFIIWNTTENRQENQAVYPNRADADDAITRLQSSRDRAGQPQDNLVSKQVG